MGMERNNNNNTYKFAAIERRWESNIVQNVEVEKSGRNYVFWGANNEYPNYLHELYNSVTSLRTIIKGTRDFVLGNEVSYTKGGIVNKRGESIEELVCHACENYLVYGGFAILVARGEDKEVSELFSVDMRYLRWDKEAQVFYYSENFVKKFGRSGEYVVYPKFIRGGESRASIILVKDINTGVYPFPVYGASVKSCEIERSIDDFHLNAIKNGFACSYIVNFNDGKPSDEIKDEIERTFNEKFTGTGAGQVLFSFNESRESQTTIQKIEVQDFGEKYQALARHSRQQIYNAFRATPNLFGLPTETTGFSEQEYNESFKLYNRTVVRPIQNKIKNCFEQIFNEDVLSFVSFSLE